MNQAANLAALAVILASGACLVAAFSLAGVVYLHHRLQDTYDEVCDCDHKCGETFRELGTATQRNSQGLKTLFRHLQTTQDRVDGLEMRARDLHADEAEPGNVPSVR